MHLLMKGTYLNTCYKCHFGDNYTDRAGAGSTKGLHSGPWTLNQTHKADRLLVSTLREQQNGTDWLLRSICGFEGLPQGLRHHKRMHQVGHMAQMVYDDHLIWF
ncbi:uncharacterized protein LAJ45_02741 [Morchella importuna]|uniref:uncharacterized protein n=1 Tax=Morchella importuna TaxID=1174673 RepID=UPI001E8D80C6|nr:uncharacterized protein LAJ45_02741 [Morchella importuna]KAH8153154.1 hypothetical protein LAJ45_02741 [Morchella importuna]